jgi:hypothetical protein
VLVREDSNALGRCPEHQPRAPPAPKTRGAPHPPPCPSRRSNPVSFMNWLGSGIAIWGTYLYTVATDKHKEEMAAKKKAA